MRPILAAALTLLALAACPAPAGGTPDSGSAPDAGADAGAHPDAGMPPDAGPHPDAGSPDAGSGSGSDAGAQSFPASSLIYQDISGLAPDPNSATTIGTLADGGGWGTQRTHLFQIDFGLTILHADDSVVPRAFTPTSDYSTPDCDMTAVPVPPGGAMEATPDYACDTSQNDCHLLVYQGARLYEAWQATIAGGQATGSPFTMQCEVVWDLTHDYWQPGTPYSRGDQCTSADAAGMPIAPLLATGAELQAGVVSHALRFTLPNAEIQAGYYLHPGTHAGGPSGGAGMPTYAARFRLRQSFDVTTLPSAGATTLALALQRYGMFLDDGGNIPLTIDQSASPFVGSHDLAALQVTDFEIVPSPDPEVALTDQCTRTPITE